MRLLLLLSLVHGCCCDSCMAAAVTRAWLLHTVCTSLVLMAAAWHCAQVMLCWHTVLCTVVLMPCRNTATATATVLQPACTHHISQPCLPAPLASLPPPRPSPLQLVFGKDELSSLNQHRLMLARQIVTKMLDSGGGGPGGGAGRGR